MIEGGGGEAEGFEQAEALLIDHASHGDQQSAHAILHDRGRRRRTADRLSAEADHERSSELDDEERSGRPAEQLARRGAVACRTARRQSEQRWRRTQGDAAGARRSQLRGADRRAARRRDRRAGAVRVPVDRPFRYGLRACRWFRARGVLRDADLRGAGSGMCDRALGAAPLPVSLLRQGSAWCSSQTAS